MRHTQITKPSTVQCGTAWPRLFPVHCKFLLNRNSYCMWLRVLGTTAIRMHAVVLITPCVELRCFCSDNDSTNKKVVAFFFSTCQVLTNPAGPHPGSLMKVENSSCSQETTTANLRRSPGHWPFPLGGSPRGELCPVVFIPVVFESHKQECFKRQHGS